MRIARFRHAGEIKTGQIHHHGVRVFAGSPEIGSIIAGGIAEAHRREVAQTVPLEEVQLLAPLQPSSIRDFVAFEEHVEGVRRSVDGSAGVPDAWYDAPTFYFTNPHAIYGPGDDVPFPAASVARDFELEVAAIAGPDRSIFGYTIFNDWSARDLQSREMQVRLGPAKGKDFASSLGPWIVTADELEPYRDADGFLDLWCTAAVNGVEVGRDLLSNMGWTFEAMIAYAGRDSRVEPGDVLGSGTVGNGGCLAELWGRNGTQDPPPLTDGDVVTLTVEGIGSLTNRITSGAENTGIPRVRRRDPAQARAERQS
ncbi:putative hydroxylase [Actinoplanes missouriensis 431]|uniref:Putative hydroxylase n=1 Tax=Actinoplanes missouriensis (strain ATCC 14538 / DSM 43046 / CBS 188.64 / JCM 3121 / NBRC 102363 / NCIMB 12654 / NRRL B-3342 / UNCC 431) TaxID=512565 RepID=I0H7B4_ACTM4|nr:fumarylacetoacetate hydrolase family protein [Actinoplanes missouriensis]BAL88901.1 putative hydroxylase [Actinoplanes missouriensis 431]